MANFKRALDYVFENEGGFTSNKNDRGGVTKYGITKRTYSTYLKQEASDGQVFSMPIEVAERVYKTLYWDALKLDEVENDNVAVAMFDQAVNRGVSRIAKDVQALIGVDADGLVGEKTIEAINKFDPSALIKSISQSALDHYHKIISRDQSQEVFKSGWEKRANKLLTLLA